MFQDFNLVKASEKNSSESPRRYLMDGAPIMRKTKTKKTTPKQKAASIKITTSPKKSISINVDHPSNDSGQIDKLIPG